MSKWKILAVLAAIVFIPGFFFSPSFAGAIGGHGIISVTTNDPDSVRDFFVDLGFEWWPGPGPKGIAHYQSGCLPGTIYLGLASLPAPRPAIPPMVACISLHPEEQEKHQSWCGLAQRWKGVSYVMLEVSEDGYTIICAPPWMKQT